LLFDFAPSHGIISPSPLPSSQPHGILLSPPPSSPSPPLRGMLCPWPIPRFHGSIPSFSRRRFYFIRISPLHAFPSPFPFSFFSSPPLSLPSPPFLSPLSPPFLSTLSPPLFPLFLSPSRPHSIPILLSVLSPPLPTAAGAGAMAGTGTSAGPWLPATGRGGVPIPVRSEALGLGSLVADHRTFPAIFSPFLCAGVTQGLSSLGYVHVGPRGHARGLRAHLLTPW
jgi:hypothetical protein